MILRWLLFVGAAVVLSGEVSSCQSNEYPLSDGQCCPMCNPGTRVSKDCTEDSGTGCEPCKPMTFMNKLNGLKSCFSCTTCSPGAGLFVQTACAKLSDTVCGVSPGYFCQSYSDSRTCNLAKKHSSCPSGQMIKEPGTSTTDTVCEDCPQGHFSVDGANCTSWTKCSETQQQVKAGSPTSDVVCASASRTHYALSAPSLFFIVTLVALAIQGKTGSFSNRSCNNV